MMRAMPFVLLLTSCGRVGPGGAGDTGPRADGLTTIGVTPGVQVRAIRLRDGAFEAELPWAGLRGRFDGAGVRFTGEDGAPALGLAFAAWGRTGAMTRAAPAEPAIGACASQEDPSGGCVRRLEYARGAVTEWWVGLGNGVEQGWTVSEAPPGRGALVFEVAVDQASSLDAAGPSLAITDARGQAWTVRGVSAWDARGAPLDADARFEDGALVVEVDDAGAAYPVTVDPIYETANWTFMGASWGRFGRVVANAGDVNGDGFEDALVSADYGRGRGQVFLYLGSAAGLSGSPDATLTGESTSDELSRCAGAGDVNGDGYDDVIVGAYQANGYLEGRAYVHLGGPSGLDEEAAVTLDAPSGADTFGVTVASAGDVNGDGYLDVIVGATTSATAYVYHGGASGPSTTPSTTLSRATGVGFAGSLAGAGDVNGDGYDDVIVGAYGVSSNAGAAYVYHGSATGLTTTASTTLTGVASSYFGMDVAGAGDVDGDGYDDVVVGASGYWSSFGGAFVYLGSASGVSTAAATSIRGEAADNYFGRRVAALGDVDGDGYDDIAVGAYGYDAFTGRAYVFPGSASGTATAAATTLTGVDAYDYFGTSLAGVDADGDGSPDLLLGAMGYEDNGGGVWRYAGSSAGISSSATEALETPVSEVWHTTVAAAGDVNGDGYPDIVVGCMYCAYPSGKVYVFQGGSAGPSEDPDATLVGSSASAYTYFGSALDAAGDVNGDGYGDLVVGEYGYASRAGIAWIYQGSGAGLGETPTTSVAGSAEIQLGYAVAGAGDVDGDGYDDVAVSAPGYAYGAGRVYLHAGGADGLDTAAAVSLTGGARYDAFGQSIAGGDVDADGYADLAVGAIGAASDAGRVAVFHGSPSGLTSGATTTLTGGSAEDGLGSRVVFCDVDGDGYDDLLAGASGYDAGAGAIYVHVGTVYGTYPTADTTLTGSADDGLGSLIACAGDVDADGDEEMVGAFFGTEDQGEIHLFLGSAGGLGSSPSVELVGEQTFSYLGESLAGPGDVNGDGFDDVLAGGNEIAWLYRGYDVDADMDGHADSVDCDAADTGVGGPTESFPDVDGDGYGDASAATTDCTVPTGNVYVGGDCDDGDASVSPVTSETCDGVDDDCSGVADDGLATNTLYADADGDGYGDEGASIETCWPTLSGYTRDATDCDDGDAAASPAATEVCDGRDDDCDGTADEDGASGSATYYLDADGDGYGLSGSSRDACDAPSGYVADASDCDDASASVHTGASETCDGVDQDCDGETDEGVTTPFWRDADGDGYGDASEPAEACALADGYAANAEDCDDTASSAHPGGAESCDTLDNDCDGETDEGVTPTWYRDADGDGFGNVAEAAAACVPPEGHVSSAEDCDDTDGETHPGAIEQCDEADDDCDEQVDEGVVPTWHRDADGDGYGSATETVADCDPGSGWVSDDTDCDDADPSVAACPEEPPADTDVDTGADVDTDPPEGCGCASSSGAQSALVVLALVLAAGTRRRRAPRSVSTGGLDRQPRIEVDNR